MKIINDNKKHSSYPLKIFIRCGDSPLKIKNISKMTFYKSNLFFQKDILIKVSNQSMFPFVQISPNCTQCI